MSEKGSLGEYLELKGIKRQEAGENCIMRSLVICALQVKNGRNM
jgi:hypothetical protein